MSSPAVPDPVLQIPFIRAMRWWRSFSATCCWVAVVGLFLYPPVFVGAVAVAVLSGAMAIGCMGRAAWGEVGAGYAGRHVVLALLLSPVFLLGVWLVPALVESDLSKWRRLEQQHRRQP